MRYSFLGDHNNLIFDAVFCRSRAYEIKRQKSTGKTLGEKNPRRSHFNAVSDSDRNVSRMKKLSRSARRIKSLRKKRIEKILFASQKEVYSFLLVTFLALWNIALTFCSFVKSLVTFFCCCAHPTRVCHLAPRYLDYLNRSCPVQPLIFHMSNNHERSLTISHTDDLKRAKKNSY